MSTERTIDATKVNPSATAEGDAFVMTSAGGSLKKCDIDAITARLKELGVVSGRNIVKDSHPDKETTEYTLALLEYTEELAVGDIITITLFGELGSQKEYLQAIHNGGDGSRGATRLSKISDGIYRGTLTVHATDGDGALHIYAVPSAVTSASKVKCVMVERGKTGSLMWTPAPEDVADLLAKSGGVKSIFPTCYTSHPQSAEKGVRHERQNLRSKGCLEVSAGTGNPRRTVRPLRGHIRRSEKIKCRNAANSFRISVRRFERYNGIRNISVRQYWVKLAGDGWRNDNAPSECISACLSSRRRRPFVFQSQKWCQWLGSLENRSLKYRKEVVAA